MKKLILLTLLFVGLIGMNCANAQKKDKKKDNIIPIGIECDQISVSVSSTGKIKFSEPVNLFSVGLVDKITNEIVMDIPFCENGSKSVYRTVMELTKFIEKFDALLEFELVEGSYSIIVLGVKVPCSRQIVIGQK